MKVNWSNCISCPFSVSNGVRRGGVLSPYLCAVYIDDLSVELNCVKAGCFLGNSRLNHIICADDLCCLSASLDSLQDLVNVCSNYAVKYDITLIVVNQLVHRFCLSIFRFQMFQKFVFAIMW